MNRANDIEQKIQDATLQKQGEASGIINPQTGKPRPIEERYEESLIKFEEESVLSKQREETLLGKIIDRDQKNIKLQNDVEELKRNYRLLENRHFSQIKKDITDENRQAETDPEKIIQNTFIDVVEKKALEAKKANEGKTTF